MGPQFKQKQGRFKSTFNFADEELTYTFDDSNRKGGMSVNYSKIPIRRSHNKMRLWQVKYFLVGLAVIAVMLGVSLFYGDVGQPQFLIGPSIVMVGLLLRFQYKRTSADATRIPLDPPLFVLQDKQHDVILAEIDKRYLESVRKKHGTVNFDKPYYDELKKFNWLRDFDIISPQEYAEARKKIAAMRDKNAVQPTHTHNIN